MRWSRWAAAAVAGAAAALVVFVSLGLPAAPAGAGDNGDGARLYCGAGLVPATADSTSNWKGGVVLDFGTGNAPCPDPIASSALGLLRIATIGAGPTWSLARLGVLYAVLVGLAAAAAAWAVTVRGRTSLLVLGPALLPLVGTTYSRFFVSTFSEPAGLLGAYMLCLGVGTIAVTGRRLRPERCVGLLLTAGGGLLAATAKTAYAPLLLTAVIACAMTAVQVRAHPGRWDRAVGPALAVLMTVAAIAPVAASLAWQERNAAVINAHNLVFTLVLPEVGDAALAPLGLPAAAASVAGQAYYPDGAAGYPGSEVVEDHPQRIRADAFRLLLADPPATLRAIGVGMESTLGRDVGYLPTAPLTAAQSTGTAPPVPGTVAGEQGATRAALHAWLEGLAVPWLPFAVALAGMVCALVAGRRPDRHRLGTLLVGLTRTAGLAALSAVLLVIVAVLGDGYFEIAKHTWLAAYLLDVTVVALVLAGAVLLAETVLGRDARAARRPGAGPRRYPREP